MMQKKFASLAHRCHPGQSLLATLFCAAFTVPAAAQAQKQVEFQPEIQAQAQACEGPAAMGVSRTIEIDGAEGGVYGSLSPRANHKGLLNKKEVILTFDDGPMPAVTRQILDTLDKACVKATFFSVGRMALAYPQMLREVMAHGHTVGTHTYSHPFNMPRMKPDKAHAEIEQGFAAVAAAAGGPIAPFFRFTGLSDSAALVDYLRQRQIAAFTVDVVSNDSYIHDPTVLARRTIAEVEARQGGIILFHDIKSATTKALPRILAELKARGYSVVHVVAKAPAAPQIDLLATYAAKLEKSGKGSSGPQSTQPVPRMDTAPGHSTDLKGGMDLVRDTNGGHPGSTAFVTGFPSASSSSAVHAPAQPSQDAATKPSKGALWETLELLTGGLLTPGSEADKP